MCRIIACTDSTCAAAHYKYAIKPGTSKSGCAGFPPKNLSSRGGNTLRCLLQQFSVLFRHCNALWLIALKWTYSLIGLLLLSADLTDKSWHISHSQFKMTLWTVVSLVKYTACAVWISASASFPRRLMFYFTSLCSYLICMGGCLYFKPRGLSLLYNAGGNSAMHVWNSWTRHNVQLPLLTLNLSVY